MRNYLYLTLAITLIISFLSCEEEYIPEIANAEPEIVVEGYIEAGKNYV